MDHLGFDPASMNYVATAMQQPGSGGMGDVDPFSDMLLHPHIANRQSVFEFAGSEEDLSMQQQVTPSLERTFSTLEDSFSDLVSHFDTTAQNEAEHGETPTIDGENKLLSFSLPHSDYRLLTSNYQRTLIRLSAQLHGMFFLAESPWATAGDALPAPSELTCYRRNLFQITGEITVPRSLKFITTDAGVQIPIVGQNLVIHATESTEGNSVTIISVPWKTPTNPNVPSVGTKVEREPPAIPIDPTNLQDPDSDFTNFPFQWKRLQFRTATANNGRRKELQQHFTVRVRVMATLATGGKVPICEVHSGAIIVRGRSPRNFQSRKDLLLTGAGNARKTSHLPAQPSRISSGESTNKTPQIDAPKSAPVRTDAPAPPVSTASFYDPNDGQPNLDFFDWKAMLPAQPGARTSVPQRTSPFDRAHNHYAVSSPEITHIPLSKVPPSAPITLSLVEDDSPPHPKPSQAPPEQRSAKKLQIIPQPPSFSLNTINSPDESADLLYEYFPLGLDDWMPPVIAVYRPHGVHHSKLPSNPRDPKASGRSKRLYSQDVG